MVPEKITNSGIKVDVDAMLAAVTPKTRMRLYRQSQQSHRLLSHAGRTGRLHAGLPPRCAAGDRRRLREYVRRRDYEDGTGAGVAAFGNVVMTRTFSKIHGLAGSAHRLGSMRPPACAMCSTASAGPSIRRAFSRQRVRPAHRATSDHVANAAGAQRQMAGLADARKFARPAFGWMTASANFLLIHFPPGAKNAERRRCFPYQRAA